uniref:Uncharacterized protein n=1 Tax=Romanomermis culicivorax TaxID=13658 RepID=A0A915L724_ROMCU
TQPFHEGSPRSPNNSLTAVGNDVQAAFQQPTASYIDPAMSVINPTTYSPQYNMTAGQMYSPDAAGFSATGSVVSNGSGLSRRLPVRQVDLLSAADSITNTMSSLVKELDSDDENKGGDLSNVRVDGRFQQDAQLDNTNNVTSYK